MLEKIWIISLTLIALFNGVKLEELHTEYLDTDKPIDVSGYKNFTVCMHIKDDLKKDDTFYLIIACDEKGAKIEKKLYYSFREKSCEETKKFEVDLSKPENQLDKHEEKTDYDSSNSDKIYNEYKLKKLDDNDKYMIFLVKDFTGNKLTIYYASMSPITLVIILACSIVGGVIIIVVVIIIICCCVCRKRKVAAVQQQYQSSFVNEPIVPQE